MNDLRKYRILIIEPSQVVRAGLTALLGQNGFFVVSSALSDLTYFNQNKIHDCNLILINPSVVNYDRRENTRAVLGVSVDIPLLAISYSPYEEELMNQYDGCINIYDTQERIINKLKNAQESIVRRSDAEENNTLSSRERVILAAVAKGKTNKEIADQFHISIYTVITHRKNISHKLGINTISGLTVYAILNKLIDTDDFLMRG